MSSTTSLTNLTQQKQSNSTKLTEKQSKKKKKKRKKNTKRSKSSGSSFEQLSQSLPNNSRAAAVSCPPTIDQVHSRGEDKKTTTDEINANLRWLSFIHSSPTSGDCIIQETSSDEEARLKIYKINRRKRYEVERAKQMETNCNKISLNVAT